MSNVSVKDLIKKKEQLKNKARKTVQLHVPSLEDNITVKAPDKALIMEALEVSENNPDIDANEYLVVECCVEPNLKDAELLKAFECDTPLQLVGQVFEPGEIISIADHLGDLAGINNKVTLVDAVKN